MFFTPLLFWTGAKDHFLIKESFFVAVTAVLAVLFFVFSREKNPAERKVSVSDILLLLFLAAVLASFFEAQVKTLSAGFAVYIASSLFLYYLASRDMISLRALDYGFFSAVIVSLYGLLQHSGFDFIGWQTNYNFAPSSTLGNPNFLAGYLVAILPYGLFRMYSLMSFPRKRESTIDSPVCCRGMTTPMTFLCKRKSIIFFSSGSALILVTAVLTNTRGAWLALAVSLSFLVFGLVLNENAQKILSGKKYFLVFFLLAAAVLLLRSDFLKPRLSGIFHSGDSSRTERLFKWKVALKIAKVHPLFGVGADNLKVHFSKYQADIRESSGIKIKGTSESNVHNEYFQILAETGLAGFLPFVFLLVFSCYKVFSRIKKLPAETIFIFSGITGFSVMALTNFPLHIVPTANIFFLYLGFFHRETALSFPLKRESMPVIPAKAGIYDEKQLSYSRFRVKHGMTIGVAFFIIYFFSFKPLAAEYYRRRGDLLSQAGMFDEAADKYKKAIRLYFPKSERTAYDLGMIYVKKGEYKKALEAFGLSVKLRNYGEVYNNIGNCHYLMGDYGQALKNWREAVRQGLPDEKDQVSVIRNIETVEKIIFSNTGQ